MFVAYGLTRTIPDALFLVRPDRHVAYRAIGLDVGALATFIELHFDVSAAPTS